jgi:hypothetical protein
MRIFVYCRKNCKQLDFFHHIQYVTPSHVSSINTVSLRAQQSNLVAYDTYPTHDEIALLRS